MPASWPNAGAGLELSAGEVWWKGWKDEGRDRTLLVLGSAVSVVIVCLALVGAFRNGGRMRPPRLIRLKMVWDLVMFAFIMIQAAAMDEEFCQGVRGQVLAFFSHVLFLGSEVLYAAFCIDVIYTVADPFSNAGREVRNSLIVVLALAGVTGAFLVSHEDWVGETFIPICYTNTKHDAVGASLLNVAFIYAPVVVCYILSMTTSIHATVVLGTRLAGFDMRTRVRCLRQLQEFVFMHGLMWGAILILYLPVVILVEAPWHDENEDVLLRVGFMLFIFLVGARGLYLLPFCKRVLFSSAPVCDETSTGGSSFRQSNTALSQHLSKSLQRDTLRVLLRGMIDLLSEQGELNSQLDQRKCIIIDPDHRPTNLSLHRREIDSPLSSVSGRVATNNHPSFSDSASVPLLSDIENGSLRDGDPALSSIYGSLELHRREIWLALRVISPMIVACIVSVLFSILLRYHLTITLLAGFGILLAMLLAIIVWWLSVKRVKHIHRATIIEHLVSTFVDIRDERVTMDLLRAFSTSAENSATRPGDPGTEFKLSQGRSGSFLFVTADKRWIVKTIPGAEKKVLTKIAADLALYWREHPDSALGRLYGLFSLRFFGRTFHLIVMENIVPTLVDVTFDLKGSWIDRNGAQPVAGKVYYCKHCSMPFELGKRSSRQCRLHHCHEPRRLLKDNDFQSGKVLLPLAFAGRYKQQLTRDAEFLADHHLMDYSLLLGIQNGLAQQMGSIELDTAKSEGVLRKIARNIRSGAGVPAMLMKGPSSYHIGIIDYLQEYTWKKRLERLIKLYLFCKRDTDENGFTGISSVDPNQYRNRFVHRVVEEVIVELKDLVQVVRKDNLAPIAILDVTKVISFDQLDRMVKDASASAQDYIFEVEFDEEKDIYSGPSLNEETFPRFMEKCHSQELTHILVSLP